MDERIYLISIGGYPNYGDELITAAWLRFLAKSRPDAEVWLDTRYPGNASALFAGMHPHLHTTDAVFRAVEDSRHGSGRSVTQIVRELGTPLYDLPLQVLREATTVHLLGGGFVNAVWPENQLLVEAMRAAKDVGGARLIATGQGLLPDIGERFRGFDHVSVRDRGSAFVLDCEVGVDDALLALPGGVSRSADEPTEIVLCVQNDAQDDGVFERLVAHARRCVETWQVPRERVRYVEAIPGGDYAGYAALQDLVGEDGFVPFSALWRDGFAMGPHQVWISSRFHHHLVAAAHGARGVALSGKKGYYDVKHKSVAALGSGWGVTDGTDETVPSLDLLPFPADVTDAHHRKLAEARFLYPGM